MQNELNKSHLKEAVFDFKKKKKKGGTCPPTCVVINGIEGEESEYHK